MALEKWQEAWRKGFAPFMPTKGLEALFVALATDDSRLISGVTALPLPLRSTRDWPVETTCAVGYVGWKGNNLQTVGECEEWFVRMCFKCDSVLGDPTACSWFLDWFDETPREKMLLKLLGEVNLVLEERNNLERKLPEMQKTS